MASGATYATSKKNMPTKKLGMAQNNSSPRKKLKKTIGFHIAQRSFSPCTSRLIQSLDWTQHRNTSHIDSSFQGSR